MYFISLTRIFFWSRLSSAERYRRRTENIFMALTKNTQRTLTNCIILSLYWAFHLALKSFTFSWRETFRQHGPET